MTHEQYNASRRNHEKTAKLLNLPKGYVLHHKDTKLKTENIERYILWLPEDVIMLTKGQHNTLHKGLKVRCIETGEEFESAYAADKYYNLCRGNVLSAIKQNCKAAKMHWEYVD